MGKTKNVRSNAGNTATYKRGIVLVELKKDNGRWFDKDGLEYERVEMYGGNTVEFFVKKAIFVTGYGYWEGVCRSNKNHRSHRDTKPLKSELKCSCGSEMVFENKSPEILKVGTSDIKTTRTIRKKKGKK